MRPQIPAHRKQPDIQPPARTAATADAICPVCLSDIHHSLPGPKSRFDKLPCRRPFHLGCVAHLRVHHSEPVCPSRRGVWSEDCEATFTNQRRQHAYSRPEAIPTASASYQSQPEHQSAPPPPEHLLPLCCPRLLPTPKMPRVMLLGKNCQTTDTWTGPQSIIKVQTHGTQNGFASGATTLWAMTIHFCKQSRSVQNVQRMALAPSSSTFAALSVDGYGCVAGMGKSWHALQPQCFPSNQQQ